MGFKKAMVENAVQVEREPTALISGSNQILPYVEVTRHESFSGDDDDDEVRSTRG